VAPLGQNRQGNEVLERAAKELEWTPLQVAWWLLRRSSANAANSRNLVSRSRRRNNERRAQVADAWFKEL